MTKIDFQIHDVLIRALRSPFQSEDEFKKQAAAFKKFFMSNEAKVLDLIQKYSGYEYTNDRIPEYLVPAGLSFSKSVTKSTLEDGLPGVVQKLFDNNITNMHIFIHELTHVNQWQSDFHNKENRFSETKTGELNREGIDFWRFLEGTNEVNKEKYDELQKHKDSWDLSKKTLKEYISES